MSATRLYAILSRRHHTKADVLQAVRLLHSHGMLRDVKEYTIAVSALGRHGEPAVALELFAEVRARTRERASVHAGVAITVVRWCPCAASGAAREG